MHLAELPAKSAIRVEMTQSCNREINQIRQKKEGHLRASKYAMRAPTALRGRVVPRTL